MEKEREGRDLGMEKKEVSREKPKEGAKENTMKERERDNKKEKSG